MEVFYPSFIAPALVMYARYDLWCVDIIAKAVLCQLCNERQSIIVSYTRMLTARGNAGSLARI